MEELTDEELTDEELVDLREYYGRESVISDYEVVKAVDELREARNKVNALKKYARHTHKCHMNPWFNYRECTCGLDELLKDL